MSKKINVLVSCICEDNSCEEDDYGWFENAFYYCNETDAQDIIIDNPDGWCYNMAVASYHDMLDGYAEYEEVLFRAVIASQITVKDYETYIILKKSRNTFLVKFYEEYEDKDDGKDIIYIDDKPYVDTTYREAYWFTDLRFTDRGTTESKDVECRLWEAFKKYDKEYFSEY